MESEATRPGMVNQLPEISNPHRTWIVPKPLTNLNADHRLAQDVLKKGFIKQGHLGFRRFGLGQLDLDQEDEARKVEEGVGLGVPWAVGVGELNPLPEEKVSPEFLPLVPPSQVLLHLPLVGFPRRGAPLQSNFGDRRRPRTELR